MVSAVSSINQYIPNPEALEVIRRLQSLGVTPTGNLTTDRQRLQAAEIQKRQITLASNSEPNLQRLEGTNKDFSSILRTVDKQLPAVIGNNNVQSIDYKKDKQTEEFNKLKIVQDHKNNKTPENDPYEKIGLIQLAEQNKLRLGLIA